MQRASETAQVVRQAAQNSGIRLRTPGAELVICHASRANTYIVRSDGTLAKCPVALYHPENRVGRLLDDGRVEVDADKMSGWMPGLESGDKVELRCPMLGYADGTVTDEDEEGASTV